MRDTYLPFSVPTIGEDEIAAVVDTLRSGWLTTGPKVRRFEEEFARYVGAKHAVAVNSCTAALHLALEAVGVTRDDEVITSPMTFAATAEVIRYFGARPVFVDVDPATLNLDPSQLKTALGRCRRPRAIIPVHMGGLACDMDPIIAIARERRLKVIDDAAHALPCRYKGRMIGTIGDVTCFSFYSTKTITTGEGGMATTDDESLAERMRLMSLHGISKSAWTRYEAGGSWHYEILAPGFKYNMTDMAAALGLAQLARAEEFLTRRKQIAARYTAAFRALSDFVEPPPDAPPDGAHAWHLYVIRLKLERLRIDRDEFIARLQDAKIGVSVHFIPLHMHPYYRDTYGYGPEDFPCALGAYRRIISLPIYPGMTDGDVDSVTGAVGEICRRFAK